MAKTFRPDNLNSLVHAVYPPENYSVDCAVGTTFSLDFESLTAMLLGFLALEAEPEKQPALQEGSQQLPRRASAVNMLYSLRAISRFAPSIRVYVNHGFIHPRRHSQLFTLYDRIVRQVSFVKDTVPANFHPKVWVIRYTSTKETQAVRYRLLVQSRNLTHDHFRDLAAVLEGVPAERANPTGRQIAGFVSHLTQLPQEKTEKVPARISKMIEELPKVKFEPPEETERIDFLWNAPGVGSLMNHIPLSGEAMVLSPFLDNAFVDKLAVFEPLTLISASEAVEKLSEKTFSRFTTGGSNKIYVIDNDSVEDEENPIGATDRAYGLHAKMFLFENDKGSTTLMGSANATMRGFERNCEAMLTLSPGISIAAFRSNFLFKEKKVLNAFVREYRESDYRAVNRTEKEKQISADRSVEDARTALCRLDLYQSYDRAGRRLILRAAGQITDALDASRVSARLCPLGLVENYLDGFPELAAVFTTDGLIFTDCHPRHLSEFVHCKLILADGGGRRDFIVKTGTDFLDLMDERDKDIKRSILSGGDDFLKLILFGKVRQINTGNSEWGLPAAGDRGASLCAVLGGSIMIEDVMRACTEDPDKIDEVNIWLKDVHPEELESSDIPFIRFWKEFTAAVKLACTRRKTWR